MNTPQAPSPKPQAPDGVLVVDKPEGPTSHDVVTLTRRTLGVSRIGHTGTLDPMATGVLPLVIGRATRLAQFLTASDKSYDATIAFGRTTDTYDARGRELSRCDARPTREQIETALTQFRGTFEQTPPAFSAKNIGGERSYDIARRASRSAEARAKVDEARSAKVDDPAPTRPKPVSVSAREMQLLEFDGEIARLSMTVGAGFYVRSLAHDLGEVLGCGGVLTALRRTRSGEFGLDAAVPLADVLQSKREEVAMRLIPMSQLLPALPTVQLRGRENLDRLKNGVEMGPDDVIAPLRDEAPMVRLMSSDGDLVALAKPGKTRGFLHGWVVLG